MIYASYRTGFRGRQTVHGFRGLASNWANEAECCKSDWIEMALAHADDDEVSGAYYSALYLSARRRRRQTWADTIKGARSVPAPSELGREIAGVFRADDPNPANGIAPRGAQIGRAGWGLQFGERKSAASRPSRHPGRLVGRSPGGRNASITLLPRFSWMSLSSSTGQPSSSASRLVASGASALRTGRTPR